MTTRAVTAADEEHDHEENDDRERDSAEHLDPERCRRRLALGALGLGRVAHALELTRHNVLEATTCLQYASDVPRLWNATIAAHRREVRDAIIDTTAKLVTEQGLRSATMSRIAARTGIGRATLYKYFRDVEAILVAWHERQITAHLEHLAALRDRTGAAEERLEAVLTAYALIQHEHPGTQLAALLHRGAHVARAQQELSDLIRGLLSEGARTGELRDDVPADELASYCLHALAAAASLPSRVAVHRLVGVTLAGLRRPGGPAAGVPRHE